MDNSIFTQLKDLHERTSQVKWNAVRAGSAPLAFLEIGHQWSVSFSPLTDDGTDHANAAFCAAAHQVLPALLELCEAQARKIEVDKRYLANGFSLQMGVQDDFSQAAVAVKKAQARLEDACADLRR